MRNKFIHQRAIRRDSKTFLTCGNDGYNDFFFVQSHDQDKTVPTFYAINHYAKGRENLDLEMFIRESWRTGVANSQMLMGSPITIEEFTADRAAFTSVAEKVGVKSHELFLIQMKSQVEDYLLNRLCEFGVRSFDSDSLFSGKTLKSAHYRRFIRGMDGEIYYQVIYDNNRICSLTAESQDHIYMPGQCRVTYKVTSHGPELTYIDSTNDLIDSIVSGRTIQDASRFSEAQSEELELSQKNHMINRKENNDGDDMNDPESPRLSYVFETRVFHKNDSFDNKIEHVAQDYLDWDWYEAELGAAHDEGAANSSSRFEQGVENFYQSLPNDYVKQFGEIEIKKRIRQILFDHYSINDQVIMADPVSSDSVVAQRNFLQCFLDKLKRDSLNYSIVYSVETVGEVTDTVFFDQDEGVIVCRYRAKVIINNVVNGENVQVGSGLFSMETRSDPDLFHDESRAEQSIYFMHDLSQEDLVGSNLHGFMSGMQYEWSCYHEVIECFIQSNPGIIDDFQFQEALVNHIKTIKTLSFNDEDSILEIISRDPRLLILFSKYSALETLFPNEDLFDFYHGLSFEHRADLIRSMFQMLYDEFRVSAAADSDANTLTENQYYRCIDILYEEADLLFYANFVLKRYEGRLSCTSTSIPENPVYDEFKREFFDHLVRGVRSIENEEIVLNVDKGEHDTFLIDGQLHLHEEQIDEREKFALYQILSALVESLKEYSAEVNKLAIGASALTAYRENPSIKGFGKHHLYRLIALLEVFDLATSTKDELVLILNAINENRALLPEPVQVFLYDALRSLPAHVASAEAKFYSLSSVRRMTSVLDEFKGLEKKRTTLWGRFKRWVRRVFRKKPESFFNPISSDAVITDSLINDYIEARLSLSGANSQSDNRFSFRDDHRDIRDLISNSMWEKFIQQQNSVHSYASRLEKVCVEISNLKSSSDLIDYQKKLPQHFGNKNLFPSAMDRGAILKVKRYFLKKINLSLHERDAEFKSVTTKAYREILSNHSEDLYEVIHRVTEKGDLETIRSGLVGRVDKMISSYLPHQSSTFQSSIYQSRLSSMLSGYFIEEIDARFQKMNDVEDICRKYMADLDDLICSALALPYLDDEAKNDIMMRGTVSTFENLERDLKKLCVNDPLLSVTLAQLHADRQAIMDRYSQYQQRDLDIVSLSVSSSPHALFTASVSEPASASATESASPSVTPSASSSSSSLARINPFT